MSEWRVSSTGHMERIERGHRADSGEALDGLVEYAAKSGQHLWICQQVHVVSADALAGAESEPIIFDAESLVATLFGCYVCEQPWEPRLTRRRCPGEPAP